MSQVPLEVVHATGAATKLRRAITRKECLPQLGTRVEHGERTPLAHHPLYASAEVCGSREVEPQGQQGVQVFQLEGVPLVVA